MFKHLRPVRKRQGPLSWNLEKNFNVWSGSLITSLAISHLWLKAQFNLWPRSSVINTIIQSADISLSSIISSKKSLILMTLFLKLSKQKLKNLNNAFKTIQLVLEWSMKLEEFWVWWLMLWLQLEKLHGQHHQPKIQLLGWMTPDFCDFSINMYVYIVVYFYPALIDFYNFILDSICRQLPWTRSRFPSRDLQLYSPSDSESGLDLN